MHPYNSLAKVFNPSNGVILTPILELKELKFFNTPKNPFKGD
jgi:hypothetical protein